MSQSDAQDSLTLMAGATLLAVGLTDLHLRYVKPQMQPLLVLAGAVLVVLGARGLVGAYRDLRGADDRTDDAHGHAPSASTWLIALPLLVLSLVAPPSLGSYAAARSDTRIAEPVVTLPALPESGDEPVEMTLTDYYTRVLYAEESLEGRRLRLSGFVTPVDGRWFVTRMSLSCCAADGRPVKVLTAGAPASVAPPADAWVEVVGVFTSPQSTAADELPLPTLELESVRRIEQPRNPYE